MKKIVKVETNGKVTMLDAPEEISCAWCAEQIGCEWVEVVHPKRMATPFILIVDEEGLLKDRPVLNVAGSWLYETDVHGAPIAGNILILREEIGDEGPEFAPMDEEDAKDFVKDLGDRKHLLDWVEQIEARIQLMR